MENEGQEVAEQETIEDLMENGESGILENDPLNSIFGDNSAAETVSDEVVTAPVVDEKVIETPVVTTEEPKPEVKAETAQEDGWKNAYFAEKKRRQAAEVPAQAKEPEAFDWTNPEKTIESIKTDLRAENQANFLNMSGAQCSARHEDYQEKYQTFTGMAQANPAILETMVAQPDPAQWAYDQASQKMFTDEVGADPAAYREKIAAEERAKLETEFKTKAAGKAAIVAGLPPSAASLADNVPTNAAPKDALTELFPGQVAS
jgi:hypothetical protein